MSFLEAWSRARREARNRVEREFMFQLSSLRSKLNAHEAETVRRVFGSAYLEVSRPVDVATAERLYPRSTIFMDSQLGDMTTSELVLVTGPSGLGAVFDDGRRAHWDATVKTWLRATYTIVTCTQRRWEWFPLQQIPRRVDNYDTRMSRAMSLPFRLRGFRADRVIVDDVYRDRSIEVYGDGSVE